MDHGKIVASGSVGEIKSSFQKYEKYYLEVKNLSELDIQKITQMEGVANCSRLLQANGVLNIEIGLLKNSMAISDILQFILQNNGKILKCTMKETTFEDVFHSLFRN